MGMEIETKSVIKEVEPVMTNFATPYSAADQIGAVMEITDALDDTKGTGVLLNISCIDKNKTKKGIDIRIFKSNPSGTTSVDNGALSYPDSEVTNLLGRVSITSSDYADTALSSDACIKNIGLTVASATPGSRSLWVIFQATEAATYAAINDLNFKFGILQD